MALTLDALRAVDINKEIETYMQKYVKLINYADQDILNGLFKGMIGTIDPKYDVMTIDIVHSYEEIIKLRRPTCFYSKTELCQSIKNPSIIHYTTNMLIVRPWYLNANHPLTNEFRKYMNISPWKDRKLSKMVFNSKEAKLIMIINKLPKILSYRILGIIHSELRPRYIKLRAK